MYSMFGGPIDRDECQTGDVNQTAVGSSLTASIYL